MTPKPANLDAMPNTPNMPNPSVISEMKELFAQLSREMNARFDAITSDLADLKETVNFNSTKIQEVEKNIISKLKEEIESKNKVIEEKIVLMELHQRKQNLLVYGVAERGNNENIYETVCDVLIHFIRISRSEAQRVLIENAHRLPAPQHGSSTIRPIIIRFVLIADRDRLLNAFEQSRRLRPKPTEGPTTSQHPTPQATAMSGQTTSQAVQASMTSTTTTQDQQFARVTIRTDLPPVMKRERGRLATIAYKLRKDQNLSTRIRINGTKIFIQTRKQVSGAGPHPQWINYEDK